MLPMLVPYKFDRWCVVGRNLRQDYYTARPQPEAAEYAWAQSVDPDGRVRHRLSDTERRRWIEDMADEIRWLRSLADHRCRRSCRVVDVGCGPGWLYEQLPGLWSYVGVETSPEALDELRRRGVPHRMSVDDLEGQYDVVVAYHVIEHLTDPIHSLAQWRRLLPRGGRLLLGTPDFHSPCAVRFGDNYRMLRDPTHISLFTRESMSRMLRDHGFVIDDLRFPFPLRYATEETMRRWLDVSQVSPPWPGNWMTFYCTRS